MVGPVFRVPAFTASLVFWGSCTIYTYASKHVTAENVKRQFCFYTEKREGDEFLDKQNKNCTCQEHE